MWVSRVIGLGENRTRFDRVPSDSRALKGTGGAVPVGENDRFRLSAWHCVQRTAKAPYILR